MLERRTAPSGKDMVSHPPRSHDDYSNAAAGALLAASHRSVEITPEMFKSVYRPNAMQFDENCNPISAPAPFGDYTF